MYILYSPVTGGPVAGIFGFIVQGELKSNWNIDVPWLWWVTILVFTPLTAALQWRGIKLSAKFMLITGGLEMIIVMALAITGFIDPPSGSSISLNVFNPSFIPAGEGFALAVVFTVQGLTGWEASAPLAEETKDPKQNVPLSVFLSITLIGLVPGNRLLGRDHRLRQRCQRDHRLVRAARPGPRPSRLGRRLDHHPDRVPEQRPRGPASRAPTSAPGCGTAWRAAARSPSSWPRSIPVQDPEQRDHPRDVR